MNKKTMRYFKVILSSLALFMVYLWIAVMLNACGNNSTTKKEDPYAEDVLVEEGTEDEFESEFDGETASEDEFQEDGEALADEGEEDQSEPGDYTSAPTTSTTKTFPVEEKASSNHSSSSVRSGKYLVIAGSYLIEDNARKMMNKLKNKGFDAEIVHFNFSQYHSICAGRYASQSTAKNTARSLKNMGIDAYVHTKQ